MKRKGLLLVVSLLATASLMAAMAVNNVGISNKADLKVMQTGNSLISLEAINWTMDGKGHAAETAYLDANNDLVFNFGKGVPNSATHQELFGLQRGSSYEWLQLFRVSNRDNESQSLFLVARNVPEGVHIYAKERDAATSNYKEISHQTNNGFVSMDKIIAKDQQSVVDVRIVVDKDAANVDTATTNQMDIVVGTSADGTAPNTIFNGPGLSPRR